MRTYYDDQSYGLHPEVFELLLWKAVRRRNHLRSRQYQPYRGPITWRWTLRILLELIIPDYLFAKVCVKRATVLELRSVIDCMEDGGGLRILGHYQVKLVVDRYEKVEPHERIGYMSVSKALYRKLYVGGTFLVCCQWNRNMPEEARMWPAK